MIGLDRPPGDSENLRRICLTVPLGVVIFAQIPDPMDPSDPMLILKGLLALADN